MAKIIRLDDFNAEEIEHITGEIRKASSLGLETTVLLQELRGQVSPLTKAAVAVDRGLTLIGAGSDIGEFITILPDADISNIVQTSAAAIKAGAGYLAIAGIVVAAAGLAPATATVALAGATISILGLIITGLAEYIEKHSADLPGFGESSTDALDGLQDLFDNPAVSPLIIDLDGDGVEIRPKDLVGKVYFDLDADGFAEQTAWVNPNDGLLVLDRNADGQINDITELFGSATQDGFSQLRELDENRDGIIDANDTAFEELRIWQDLNSDGISQENELITLADAGVVSITASGVEISETNNGNQVTHRGSVTFADGHSADVDDVWFENDPAYTRVTSFDSAFYDPLAKILPELMGNGRVANLRLGMTQDTELRDFVKQLVLTANEKTPAEFRAGIEALLFKWVGVEGIVADSRGAFIDAKHLSVVEKILNTNFAQLRGTNAGTPNPGPNAGHEIELKYQAYLDQIALRFSVQVLASQFEFMKHGEMTPDQVLDSPFFALASFACDQTNNRVTSFDFSYAMRSLVAGYSVEELQNDSGLDLVLSLLEGARGDVFGSNANAFEAALDAGLTDISDLAVREFVKVRALGVNVIRGTAGDEIINTNDPVPHELVRNLDGISSALAGGQGDDTLTGGKGGDYYIFRAGDGHDTIDDQGAGDFEYSDNRSIYDGGYNGNRGGTDKILLTGIQSVGAIFDRDGEDLVITFTNAPNDSIRVVGQFAPNVISKIENFIFADREFSPDEVEAFSSPEVLLTGGAGSQRVIGTSNDDVLDGGEGNDVFIFGPGSGADTVLADASQLAVDIARIGFVSTQALFTRVGNDMVLRILEDSVDVDGNVVKTLLPDSLTIKDQFLDAATYGRAIDNFSFIDVSISGEDAIALATSGTVFYVPANYMEVEFRRGIETGDNDPYDLILSSGGVEIARIDNQFGESGGTFSWELGGRGGFETFVFLDGTALNRSDLAAVTPLVGTSASDADNSVSPGEHPLLDGSSFSERISGLDGDDVIYGRKGNDIIEGGLGDDVLAGDFPRFTESFSRDFQTGTFLPDPDVYGSDTYIYKSGDGNDVIMDFGRGGLDIDRLSLVDLNPDDVTIVRMSSYWSPTIDFSYPDYFQFGLDDGDLIVTDNATGQKINIVYQFMDSVIGLEEIVFADGTIYNREYLRTQTPLVAGDRDGPSTLSGGGLIAPQNNFTEVLGVGSDNDTLLVRLDYPGATVQAIEHIQFEERNAADIRTLRVGDDLILESNDGITRIVVTAFFAEVEHVLQTIMFGNGEVWNSSLIETMAVIEVEQDGPTGHYFYSGDAVDKNIRGLEVTDYVHAGEGNDVITGGGGNDFLVGGGGNDRFVALADDGDDEIDGGDGLDTYDASTIKSSVSVDLASGLANRVSIGTDTLQSIENIVGGSADDDLKGDDQNNFISGGRGNDSLSGGDGDDALEGGAGSDTLIGGDGIDVASYKNAKSGISVSLTEGVGFAGEANGDALSGIENIFGSNYSDIIVGDNAANLLVLGSGNDIAEGRGGNDEIYGDGGSDTIDGGDGDDFIYGGVGVDHLIGGAGDDWLVGGTGADELIGGAGDDSYFWSRGDGNDLVVESTDEGHDSLTISGVSPDQIELFRFRDDLLLRTRDGEEIKVQNHFLSNNAIGLELITFSDGTNWDRANIASLSVTLTNGLVLALNDDGFVVNSDQSLTIVSADLLKNDFDVDGDDLHLVSVAAISGGTPVLLPDGRIEFTPSLTADGLAYFSYTVADGYGAQDTATVEISISVVNHTPVVTSPLDDQSSDEDTKVFFTLPSDAFSDADGDTLNLTATLGDGSALPGWLHFDVENSIFSGTPPQNFNGNLEIKVTADDGAAQVSDSFILEITPVNDTPSLVIPLVDQSSSEDEPFSFSLPSDAFADVDGDLLSYFATLHDNSMLPDWLVFDDATRTFSGTPPQDFNGSLEVKVTASDGALEVSDNFTLDITPVNDAPVAGDDGTFAAVAGASLAISAQDLLANDTDVDNDVLSILSVSNGTHGQVSIADDGSVVYVADVGYEGSDSFTYQISDGTAVSEATVTVSVLNPDDPYEGWWQGTEGSDLLFGNLFRSNQIYGAGGNDLITGGLRADELDGGAGNDIIVGLSGDDRITGGSGTDVLVGGLGRDTFVFREGSGTDIVMDFSTGSGWLGFISGGDKIEIDIDGLSSFEDLMGFGHQDGSDTIFDFGDGDLLILKNTQLAALDNDAFSIV